ncbi:hypothetical protein FSW04_16695 [Baekduia soli]|uniref:Uncharacterized protein n=1 Tax=Baekduia soli TaxID=496014 RepID=A0A5B8U7E2_9ACTN|nr:hypothetical protein [Baekduia soli]QEC49049.1 hypothetical protein FSW04_16695 [Baekduia soli]
MPPDPGDPRPDADTEAVGRAVQAAMRTVQAPQTLRVRLAEQQERSQAGAAVRRGLRRPAVLAGALGALAVALAVVLIALPAGGPGAPSVADAAALALSRPDAPAPAVSATDARLTRAEIGGIAFPNYGHVWPNWRATGARYDDVGDRDAVTVTYRGPVGDVGYTIVGGAPLAVPAGARHLRRGGLDLAVVRRDGATVMTWRLAGHTCVLASRTAGVAQLVRFATLS